MKYLKFFEKFIDNLDNIESEIIDLIKRDCAPFLEEFNFPVFRGAYVGKEEDIFYHSDKTNDDEFVYSKRKVRHNRYPEATPQEIHDDLNEAFNKRFGSNVRNGVFTSLDSDMADKFGDGSYLFFPIGKYKYYWSPIVTDLWDMLSEKVWLKTSVIERNIKNQWHIGDVYYYNGKNTGTLKKNDIANEFNYFFDYHIEYLNDYNNITGFKPELLEVKNVQDLFPSFEEYKKFKMNQIEEIKESDINYIISTYKDSDINSLMERGWEHPTNGKIYPPSNEITFICDEYYIVNFEMHDQIGLPKPKEFFSKVKN